MSFLKSGGGLGLFLGFSCFGLMQDFLTFLGKNFNSKKKNNNVNDARPKISPRSSGEFKKGALYPGRDNLYF